MTSLVKKKMNNLLTFKMLIHIFTIVSVRWRVVKRVRHTGIYGKGVWTWQRETWKHQVHPNIHLPCQWRTNLTSDHSNNILIEFPNHEKPSNGVSFMSQLDLRSLKHHLNWNPDHENPYNGVSLLTLALLRILLVLYLQQDGGHVGFCQDVDPIGLTCL